MCCILLPMTNISLPLTHTSSIIAVAVASLALCHWRLGEVEEERIGIQVDAVRRFGNGGGHLSRRLDPAQIDKGRVLPHRLADHLCGLCFTLGLDDDRLLLLFGTLHNECGAVRLLLGDLLGLYGVCKLVAELHGRDGDILQVNVEIVCPLHQTLPHQTAHLHATIIGHPADCVYLFALRDELARIELCNHRFQHLVDDGWEHALVIIRAQRAVDCRQSMLVRL